MLSHFKIMGQIVPAPSGVSSILGIKPCCGLNDCAPPAFDIPVPNVMVLEGGAFGRYLGRALQILTSVLIIETPLGTLASSTK